MVEKKSTGKGKVKPKKAVTEKIEISKPENETQKVAEPITSQGINWDVIGYSSAGITLFGAALLFMLGWAYEANWYGFFGISMSQVTIQPQGIFIQSLPGVVTIASCFSASLVINYCGHFLFQFIKQVKNRREVESFPVPPDEETKTRTLDYSISDWILVLICTEVFLLILFLVYSPIVLYRFGETQSIFTIYEMTYLGFLVLITLIVSIISFVLWFLVYYLSILFLGLYLSIRSRFKPTKKVYIDNPAEVRIPQKLPLMFLLTFLIILTSLALSAVYGINDAANGFHSGSWKVQKIALVSSSKNPFQNFINATCDADKCESGYYGLIGENDYSYFLVNWKKNDKGYFNYNSGLIFNSQV